MLNAEFEKMLLVHFFRYMVHVFCGRAGEGERGWGEGQSRDLRHTNWAIEAVLDTTLPTEKRYLGRNAHVFPVSSLSRKDVTKELISIGKEAQNHGLRIQSPFYKEILMKPSHTNKKLQQNSNPSISIVYFPTALRLHSRIVDYSMKNPSVPYFCNVWQESLRKHAMA